MQVTVHVTEDDILQGRHHQPLNCMVQRALSRACPGHKCTVGVDIAYVDRHTVELPEIVAERIAYAVNNQNRDGTWKDTPLNPFSFDVEISDEVFRECLCTKG